MKEFRFTLHEIFGYLLPGAVTSSAVFIFVWGTLWPIGRMDLLDRMSLRDLVVLLFFVYVTGHITQAVGNLVEGFIGRGEHSRRLSALPDAVSARLRESIASLYRIDSGQVGAKDIHELCDAAIIQRGVSEEREIFTYREGFYRGNFIGLSLVSLSLLSPLIRTSVEIQTEIGTFKPSRSLLLLIMITVSSSAFLSFQRYRKFRKLRITNCFLAFLALTSATESNREGQKPSTN